PVRAQPVQGMAGAGLDRRAHSHVDGAGAEHRRPCAAGVKEEFVTSATVSATGHARARRGHPHLERAAAKTGWQEQVWPCPKVGALRPSLAIHARIHTFTSSLA